MNSHMLIGAYPIKSLEFCIVEKEKKLKNNLKQSRKNTKSVRQYIFKPRIVRKTP